MLASLLALALVVAPGLASAVEAVQGHEIPRNDGWVTDLAGMLSPAEERSLETLMESYKQGSGQEVALLTVPSLEGRPIEQFALEVARAWKIGDRATSSGALLVVARDERQLRIEVGRGLEGTLTDSIAGRIIRDVIVPQMRAQRYAAGLRDGIEAIHAALGGDYGPVDRARPSSHDASPVIGIFGMLVFLFLIARTRRRYGGFRGGGSSVLPWLIASEMARGAGSGRVGGFSGGSFGHGGGGFSGFGGGGGFSGGGASGGW